MCYPNTLINGLRRRRLKNNNFPLQISHFNDYIRQSSFCLWLSKYMWPKATCHMSHMCVFVCAVMPVPVLVGGFPTIDMPSPFCVFPFSRPNWMCRRKILQMKDFQCTCVCMRGRCAAQYLCEAYAFFNFLQHLNFYVTFSGFISIFIFMFLFACRYEACILKFPDAAPNDRNQCECSSAVRGNHLVWNASLLVRPARHCVLQRCLSVCRLRPLLLMLQLCATNF